MTMPSGHHCQFSKPWIALLFYSSLESTLCLPTRVYRLTGLFFFSYSSNKLLEKPGQFWWFYLYWNYIGKWSVPLHDSFHLCLCELLCSLLHVKGISILLEATFEANDQRIFNKFYSYMTKYGAIDIKTAKFIQKDRLFACIILIGNDTKLLLDTMMPEYDRSWYSYISSILTNIESSSIFKTLYSPHISNISLSRVQSLVTPLSRQELGPISRLQTN